MPTKQGRFETAEAMVAALEPGYPVYCLRPRELQHQARRFLDAFPGRVLYAVKCNPHPGVLRALYDAGIRHFDTASLSEIALIREMFSDADCYFMHPVKSRSAILSANEVYRVDHYVLDHRKELEKLTDVLGYGDSRVVLVRVATPQYDAAFRLSEKFGARPDEAADLLRQVKKHGYQPGVAFHVGSQVKDPAAFTDALRVVGEVLASADVQIQYLDVGGGFPAEYVDEQPAALDDFIAVIEQGMRDIRLRKDCVVMCEPGRALVASGMTLVVQVHLRKDNVLYINDGIYHSLSETVTGHIKLPMRAIRPNRNFNEERMAFRLFGPTCDSTDVLPYPAYLPVDTEEGDWIEIGQVGAYSNAMATRFNGFFPETFVTVDDDPLTPSSAV